MTHFHVTLSATVTEEVTVEAENAQAAADLAKKYSKLSRFSYADPRNTQWNGAAMKPLLTRDELTAALAPKGH